MARELLDTVQLPEYVLCYLAYGDDSGISEKDVANVEEWSNTFNRPIFIDFKEEEGSFTSTPAFGLPCNCIEADVYAA